VLNQKTKTSGKFLYYSLIVTLKLRPNAFHCNKTFQTTIWLLKEDVSNHGQFDVSLRDLFHVLLPSVTGWTNCVKFCAAFRSTTLPARPCTLHSAISKTVACLPKPNRTLTSRHDKREGGSEHRNTQKNSKHFLKYAVTPLKYRLLPTWRLHTTKPYDFTPPRTPPDAVR
jgi:hypothetical protein